MTSAPARHSHGAVSCSQPLASHTGLRILQQGGNAADAAVAMAAALGVTMPCATGLGGDAFCLFYDAATKRVRGLNGSGRAPAGLTLEKVDASGFSKGIPPTHGFAVTVPGAAAAWEDALRLFGSHRLSFAEILQPAVEIAESGFCVGPWVEHLWKSGESLLRRPDNSWGEDLLVMDDLGPRSPSSSDVFRNPKLARVMKTLGENGARKTFYDVESLIAKSIVAAVQKAGGVLTTADMQGHASNEVEPIFTDFRGHRLWEIPPNGQGIVALIALNILDALGDRLESAAPGSADYFHFLIEAIRLAFADAERHCADTVHYDVPLKKLLSKEYARSRAALIRNDEALKSVSSDIGVNSLSSEGDTVYLCAVDSNGNACSFINSNFMGFGTGIVPENCGFSLHNRGLNFSLEEGHANCVAPLKRPYHTIIPAMVTSPIDSSLIAVYGVMGGFMQPQGHVQVLLNMILRGLSPQEALQVPRFCVGPGHEGSHGDVSLEEGIPAEVDRELERRGHSVVGPLRGFDRTLFGRGHVIRRESFVDDVEGSTIAWIGGCDPRSDGVFIGF